MVANEVLAMQMPTTPAQLQNLTNEIRQKVGELGGVEAILQQSTDDIQRAEKLLDHARRAKWVLLLNLLTFINSPHKFWWQQVYTRLLWSAVRKQQV